MAEESNPRRKPTSSLVLAIALLLGAVFFFFEDVNSLTSDYTAGDAAWTRQVVHNSTHGRLFQMSVYYNNLGGVRENPYAYANTLALHSNLTPIAVAQLYRLMPTEQGLFTLVMFFNYLGLAFWMFWTLKDDPGAPETLPLAIIGLALWCGFFWTVSEKNHFPLYSGPFIFALHYFRSKKGPAFWLSLTLCLGVSEDTAMFLACYGFYLTLLEPHNRRRGAAVSILSIIWILTAIWLQGNVLRHGMTLAHSSNITGQLSDFLSPTFNRRVMANIAELLRAIAALAPLLCLDLLAQPPEKRAQAAVKLTGIVFLAPASHWAISAMVAGGHHWHPVVLCALLGHLELLRTARPQLGSRASKSLLAVFIGLNSFGLYYGPLKHWAKETLLPFVFDYPAPDRREATAHNRRVIAFFDSLPQETKISALIAPPIGAFVVNRPHIWFFPSLFDQTDVLVIDKKSPAAIAPSGPLNLTARQIELLNPGFDGKNFPQASRAALVSRLIGDGTHRLLREDADIWALERIQPSNLPEPPASIGFGFLSSQSSPTPEQQ